jgi:lipopolysaccharide transport system ATP-binding protein
MPPIINVENLGKQYSIEHQAGEGGVYRRFSEDVVHLIGRSIRRITPLAKGNRKTEGFWALRNVSFQINQGDIVGVIGRNGAGKSTLLKILSRITEPTEGRVHLRGRVSSLLEVGTGFHPELTGRENVFLNGAILGMSRGEIRRKFDEIVSFAEVERFIDTPVKRYSSGMYVRLAFAIAAHLEPEILIVDEVLAVGDIEFQKKCLGRMGEVARGGRTVLFVSHNMVAIRELTQKCFWLSGGSLAFDGPTQQAIGAYLSAIIDGRRGTVTDFDAQLDKPFQVLRASIVDQARNPSEDFSCDDRIRIELLCEVRGAVPGLYGYLQLDRGDGLTVLVSDSFDVPPNQFDSLGKGRFRALLTVPRRVLGPGEYVVYVNFADRLGGMNPLGPGYIGSFRCTDPTTRRGNARGGLVSTLVPWEVEPLTPQSTLSTARRNAQDREPLSPSTCATEL